MTGLLSLRRAAALVGSLVIVASLVGCSEAEPPERIDGLAVVVGARSNMPTGGLRGESVDRAESAVHWEALLSVVVADGAPFQHLEARRLPVNENNEVAAEQDRRENLGMLAGAVRSARAKTEETDLLAALDLAARSISNADQPRTIVVLDSGLSTVGPLDFTQPKMLDADPQDLAADLATGGDLPDLSGADVVLQGIGDTSPSQPRLGQRQRDNLVAIWRAIIEAAGAEDVVIERTPVQGQPAADLPRVTPVAVSDGVTCTVETVELDGGDVAFEPESAEFVDEAAALAVLRPIADRMNSEGLSATLTGTTANVDDLEGQQELSLERANAVMGVLVEFGVLANRMIAVGLGSEFPGYVPDRDANGDLIAEAAAANRQVFIDLEKTGSVDCG